MHLPQKRYSSQQNAEAPAVNSEDSKHSVEDTSGDNDACTPSVARPHRRASVIISAYRLHNLGKDASEKGELDSRRSSVPTDTDAVSSPASGMPSPVSTAHSPARSIGDAGDNK